MHTRRHTHTAHHQSTSFALRTRNIHTRARCQNPSPTTRRRHADISLPRQSPPVAHGRGRGAAVGQALAYPTAHGPRKDPTCSAAGACLASAVCFDTAPSGTTHTPRHQGAVSKPITWRCPMSPPGRQPPATGRLELGRAAASRQPQMQGGHQPTAM